eukprot:6174178-Pyramimonas_sp.AAC.1
MRGEAHPYSDMARREVPPYARSHMWGGRCLPTPVYARGEVPPYTDMACREAPPHAIDHVWGGTSLHG